MALNSLNGFGIGRKCETVFYVLGTYKSGGIERIMSGCRDRMFHNKARDFG